MADQSGDGLECSRFFFFLKVSQMWVYYKGLKVVFIIFVY